MKHTIQAALIFSATLALPAMADPYADTIDVAIVDGWRMPNGDYMAAVRMRLKEGWKTYWRAPGEAGIPPRFNWAGSRNVADIEVLWPTPIVFSQGGMQTIGYKREVILPLRITPKGDGAMKLRAEIDLGVCRDVCVPQHVSLEARLDGAATRPVPQIAAAMASQPYSAQEARIGRATCAMAPAKDGMSITTRVPMPKGFRPHATVVETGNPALWVSDGTTRRDGNILVSTSHVMHSESAPFMIDRSSLRITILGDGAAVDILGCDAG